MRVYITFVRPLVYTITSFARLATMVGGRGASDMGEQSQRVEKEDILGCRFWCWLRRRLGGRPVQVAMEAC